MILNIILMLLNLFMAFLNYSRKKYKMAMFCASVVGFSLFAIIDQIIRHL